MEHDIDTAVEYYWCADCSTVIKDDNPCTHTDLEWLGLSDW